jgi:kanamycin kinase
MSNPLDASPSNPQQSLPNCDEWACSAQLLDQFRSATLERVQEGKSTDSIYRISDPDGHVSYLKIGKKALDTGIPREHEILNWLIGKIPVPQVLHFEEHDEAAYLLITEVAGNGVHLEKDSPEKMIELLGYALGRVHQIQPERGRFLFGLEEKLKCASERVRRGLVDEGDFDPERLGWTAQSVLEETIEKRPESEDLVFTHGDFCLPNVLVYRGALSGFIDWSRAGVADRYQDIALCYRSILQNFGEYCPIDRFFTAYGLDSIDWAKIDYYILLDELF